VRAWREEAAQRAEVKTAGKWEGLKPTYLARHLPDRRQRLGQDPPLGLPGRRAAAVHFVMVVKSWPAVPLVYAGIILVLLGYRLVVHLRPPAASRAATGRARRMPA
jgi:hypothetical protein